MSQIQLSKFSFTILFSLDQHHLYMEYTSRQRLRNISPHACWYDSALSQSCAIPSCSCTAVKPPRAQDISSPTSTSTER
jgi:hypothetical protein